MYCPMERFKITVALILSMVLFLGGLVLLLFVDIPFWGSILGIPATIIGVAFIILTFDKVNQLTLDDEE